MKVYYLFIRLLALFCLSTLASHATPIPFSSAKVLVVKGKVSYGAPDEEITPLIKETILTQGDSIVTGSGSLVHLLFSNGVALTIEEGTQLVFSELDQRPFLKDDPSEIPDEIEHSRSKFVLELKYGNIEGNASTLRDDSEFRIKTILGDVLVSGNSFATELLYNPFQRVYVLNVQNINGLVDLVTKFSGTLKFGRKSIAKKSFNAKATENQIVRIPPNQIVSIKKTSLAPGLRNAVRPFSRIDSFKPYPIEPFPADQAVVSPNGSEGPQPDEG